MNMKLIREFIRLVLEKKDVLGEPDLSNQDERSKRKKDSKSKKEKKAPDEASVAAGMPGVSTPLGTGPTYPAKVIKRTKKKKKQNRQTN